MSQLFDKIKVGSVKRSTFDLSHNQITTSDFGYLIPICYRDMVPNDDFVVKPDLFVRLAPLAVPTYGRIKCRVHHFFVPYRIMFPHWDMFITQDPNNNYIPPFLTGNAIADTIAHEKGMQPSATTYERGEVTRLISNLGLDPKIFLNPDAVLYSERFSAFPLLAYYRICLDWFTDSSIVDHTTRDLAFKNMVKDGGSLDTWVVSLLRTQSACFKKDYFTTARVSPQSGDASKVAVDLATDLNPGLSFKGTPTYNALRESPDGNIYAQDPVAYSTPTDSNNVVGQFTIEAFRSANALQKWLEKNNFIGSKLIDRILAHFGTRPSAERLDMAEFLGGSSFPIQIGDVTSTSFEQGDSDYMGLGAQAGKGVGRGSGSPVKYHAKEHGVFMSLMSIMPDTAYYQGISRFWQKGVTGEALDYFTPEFENLGFQPVLNKEVYVPSNFGDPYDTYNKDGIFGWQPQYAEYKFQQDILAGDFQAYSGTTPTGFNLDSWHLFRKLLYTNDSPLALNENFVTCKNLNNDYDRIFQYTDNTWDHFYFNIFCDVKATRPMDGFAAPTLESANEGDGKMTNLPYGGTRL